ncbi:hypothetical protein [Chromobacterium haemolyticum]|uniref:hypothetical protein n=1 Tax=Chromobacterium haemolyticum TaxID=394935 RepID=UPI0012DEEB51|nr:MULTISPECIES: hypothetical protein [Chromobacterium]
MRKVYFIFLSFLILISTTARGENVGANENFSINSNPFRATAKINGSTIDSLSLTPGQVAAIGIGAGQTLELNSDVSPVSWNPTSTTISPLVISNTPSSWKATIPSSAVGNITFHITSTQNATKTATLTVYIAPPTKVSDHGAVEFIGFDTSATQIVSLQTTLTVPIKPPASGTLFLWPGIQPLGANYLPIDNGVLQPVLTWGPSCAPGKQPRTYSTWWVSAQYVNTVGKHPGYTDCHGGPIMPVNVGDQLKMSMILRGTTWHQTVTDIQTGRSVSFKIDMKKQAQNRAIFIIEGWSQQSIEDVIFTNTTITFTPAAPLSCIAKNQGRNVTVSIPRISSDGTQCSISKIILR